MHHHHHHHHSLFLGSENAQQSPDEEAAAAGMQQQQQQELLLLPALSLTCAFSPAAVTGWDAQGRAVMGRHSVEACCDVAVLAILPEEEEEDGGGRVEEEEVVESGSESEGSERSEGESDVDEDDDPLFPQGGGGSGTRARARRRPGGNAGSGAAAAAEAKAKAKRQRKGRAAAPALVVTACDHDASLRWWELTSGRDAAVCTGVTPAFGGDGDGPEAGPAAAAAPPRIKGAGTLSLAQARGVLLSAHLDGSLVLWHVGQRRPVARFPSLPLLESIALTPGALGLLACFERHIVLARGG